MVDGTDSPRPFLTEARLVAFLIGCAPLLIFLLTWDADGASSPMAMTIREYALPILAIEGIVIGLAALSGLFSWLKTAPTIILIAAAGWLAVAFYTAVFVAVDPRLSIFLTTIWVLHGLFAAAVAFLCRTARLSTADLAFALLAGFTLYALGVAFFAVQVDHKIAWVTDIPGLGNLRRVAAYATLIAGLAVGALLWPRHRLAAIAAVAAFFTAFWTGSRATAVAVAVAVLAAAVIFPAARDKRIFLGALLGLASGFLLALAFPIEAGVGNNEVRAVMNVGDNGRRMVWGNSIRAIFRSPIVGYGEGQTAYVLPDNPKQVDDFQAHPHNLFLQWLMAWGMVGAACLAAISLWLARFLYRAGGTAHGLPFVMGAGALTVHAMFDGALYDVAPVFLFAACVGAACAKASGDSRRDPE
jgi:O-antigen ligase